MAARKAEQDGARVGREGSRWYNRRPSGEEVAEWFRTVPLHEGLDHADYIGGVTLIQQLEKSKETVGFDQNTLPVVREREDVVYVPYMKVETRLAYWHRLCALHADEWLGAIEPVEPAGGALPGLPLGFFRYSAARPTSGQTAFVGSAMRVRLLERDTVTIRTIDRSGKGLGLPVLDGVPVAVFAPASKIVAVTSRYDADPNAIMKAETGAVGRALGMAGMLIVPGSGVATAEDMLEFQGSGEPQPGERPSPPPVSVPEPSEEELRARAVALRDRLDPERAAEFAAWLGQRNITKVGDTSGAVLRGVVRKLERMLDAPSVTPDG